MYPSASLRTSLRIYACYFPRYTSSLRYIPEQCAKTLIVEEIEFVVEQTAISDMFMGLILVPLVGKTLRYKLSFAGDRFAHYRQRNLPNI